MLRGTESGRYRLSYVIDAGDFLTEVNGEWDEVAAASGGEGALAVCVIGTNLKQHISGKATHAAYADLLRRVRGSGETISLHMCGDGPGFHRSMLLTLEPLDDGAVRFTSQVGAKEDARATANFITYPYDRRHDGDALVKRRCSFCLRVRIGNAWRTPGDEIGVTETLVEYDVCDNCRDRIARALDDS